GNAGLARPQMVQLRLGMVHRRQQGRPGATGVPRPVVTRTARLEIREQPPGGSALQAAGRGPEPGTRRATDPRAAGATRVDLLRGAPELPARLARRAGNADAGTAVAGFADYEPRPAAGGANDRRFRPRQARYVAVRTFRSSSRNMTPQFAQAVDP